MTQGLEPLCQHERPKEAPGSQFHINSALTIVVIWEVNQLIENPSLCLFSLYIKVAFTIQINLKQIFFQRQDLQREEIGLPFADSLPKRPQGPGLGQANVKCLKLHLDPPTTTILKTINMIKEHKRQGQENDV